MKPQRKSKLNVKDQISKGILKFFLFLSLFVAFFYLITSQQLLTTVQASPGIYKTINFQGKIVNKADATNISNNSYSFTFKLYNHPTAGDQLPVGSEWSETQSLTVTDGIFRATLGSETPFPSTLDFNSDLLYLDITFAGEHFGSRVRLTAVPYAINAQKVSGLNVTNTTGTLTIPDATTITFSGAFGLTFTTSALTSATLPSGTITIADLATSQVFTNKTIGSTGLVFNGATNDITTPSGEHFTIMPGGTGNVGIGTTNPTYKLDVTGDFRVNYTSGSTEAFTLDASASSLDSSPAFKIKLPATGNRKGFQITNASDTYAWASFEWGVGGTDKGGFALGPGGGVTRDTNLFRETVDVLRTNDSFIVDGNIGIGTTNPLEKLNITGNASMSGSLTIGQTGTLRSQYGPLNLAYKSGLNAWATALTIQDSTGNIGVKSANPGYALDVGTVGVKGQIVATALEDENAIGIRRQTDGVTAWMMYSSGRFRFNAGARFTGVLNIDGQYGVMGGGSSGETLTYNSQSGGGGIFQSGGIDYTSIIAKAITNQTGNLFEWQDVNSNALGVINISGNIGIGTTTPTAKLDVIGMATVSANLTMGGQLQVGRFGAEPTQVGPGSIYFNTSTNKFKCYTTSWVDCDTTGGGSPVWSSLTAPTSDLTMNMYQSVGTSFATTFTYGNATSTTNLFNITDTSSNSGTGYLVNFTTASGSTLKPFHVSAAGVEALTVNSSGYVGIGTTSPIAKLDIVGDASASGNLTIGNGSTVRSAYGPLNLSYKSGLNAWTTGLTLQDTTGYVGIGTTSPQAKLDFSATSPSQSTIKTIQTILSPSTSVVNPSYAYGLYNTISPTGNNPDGGANSYGVYNEIYPVGIYNNSYGFYTDAYSKMYSVVYGSYFKSNSASTAGSQYAYYADMNSGTATKWGLYLTGEAKNYFSGNVGIGTTDPTSKLHISSIDTSVTGADKYNSKFSYTISPASAQSSGDRRFGLYSEVVVPNTATYTAGQLSGLYTDVHNSSNQNATLIEGMTSFAYNAPATTNTVGAINGLWTGAFSYGGNVSYERGIFTTTHMAGGSLGTQVGLQINQSIDAGTVTNRYGIFIDAAGSATNDYGIYQINPQKNYFAGNVGIGTTSPLEKLDITGNASMSGSLTIGQTGTLRSQYGPLNLDYKSGLNAWTTGLTLQDSTGYVGIGTTRPTAALDVNGTIKTNSSTDFIFNSSERIMITSSDSNTYDGLVDINFTTANLPSNADIFDIDMNIIDDTFAGTFNGLYLNIDNDGVTQDNTVFGIYLNNEDGVAVTDALLYLNNADTNQAVPDGIFFNSSTGGITDALDISNTEITNAINIGQNFILGDGIRQFSSSSTVWTFEDTNTNDLLTLTDLGTTGLLYVSGNVGVGTTSPTARLDVSGMATVSANLTMGGQLQVGRFGAEPTQVGPGSIYYNTATNKFKCYTTSWVDCDTTGAGGVSTNLSNLTSTAINTSLISDAADTDDLGSATYEWNSLYLSDGSGLTAGGGLFMGNDQDFLFSYDAVTSDALELSDGVNTFWSVKDQGTAADFAFNTDDLFIKNDGKIGIGTTSPLEALDIVGNASMSGNLTIGNGSAIRSAYGPLSLAYKSGLNSWAIGLTLQDTTGYVGIGTTTPTAPLSVGGGASTISNTSGNLTITPAGNLIISSGAVGIGTTNPSEALHVVGSGRFTGVGSATQANDLRITSDGTLTTSTSDVSMKTNVLTLDENTLSKVMQLNPVSFNWIDDVSGNKDIGFIAQEVNELFPGITFINPTDGKMGINYSRLPSILTKAIQEQQGQILEQQDAVERLELFIGDLVGLEFVSPKIIADTMVADFFTAQNASISGTLTVDILKANHIEGLDVPFDFTKMQDKIASVEGTLNNLANLTERMNVLEQKVQNASDSGNVVTESLSPEDVYMIASSSGLTLLGKTSVYDLNVIGTFKNGLLTIETDETAAGSIQTAVVPLKLQKDSLGNLEIMGSKIVIDTMGNMVVKESITAKEVHTNKLVMLAEKDATSGAVLSTSTGKIEIDAGETSVRIKTTSLTPDSLVFVSSENIPTSVAARKLDDETIEIFITSSLSEVLKVNWWVIN